MSARFAEVDPPSIGILTHTAIADDPRVRRQIEAFVSAGWRVFGFGASGGRSHAPPGELFEAALPPPDKSASARLQRLGTLTRLKVMPWTADAVFWSLPENYSAILKLAERHRPALWLANDWTMLPVVASLVRESSAPFIYDTHEFALEEFPENWKWRTFVRPLVRQIESNAITRAARVTCVSSGIARRLQQIYSLSQTPTTIRNLPTYSEHKFRATGERIEVLYHGIVMPNRGLEQSILSVAQWRPEFKLTIRGPGTASYLTSLKETAAAAGVTDRVRFAPSVPFTELVAAAASHDLGLFVLPAHSRQNEFVLPNKLFEYTMAGLAVCVSDVPEMAAVVGQYGHGTLVRAFEPNAIAAAINSLGRCKIDKLKAKAVAAARELCWDLEKQKLLSIANAVLAGAMARDP